MKGVKIFKKIKATSKNSISVSEFEFAKEKDVELTNQANQNSDVRDGLIGFVSYQPKKIWICLSFTNPVESKDFSNIKSNCSLFIDNNSIDLDDIEIGSEFTEIRTKIDANQINTKSIIRFEINTSEFDNEIHDINYIPLP